MQIFTSLFRNSAFSITTNIINRIGNAVVFIFIVQWLGVEKGGIYTLGVSYFLVGSRFAFWGLDHLLTREVAKNRIAASKYFNNFIFVRIVLATFIIVIFSLVLQFINYPIETKWVVFVMLLSIWPESINNLCWAGFAAFEEFHFTSISVFFGSFTQILFGFLLLSRGYGVPAMALVFLLNNLVAMIINLSIFSSRYVHKWQLPDLYFLKKQLRVAFPFVFISMFFILDNRVDTIVLSFLSSEQEIGIYGAATAVILALTMIPQGYRISILPVLSRSHQDGTEYIQHLYTQSLKYLLLIAFPLFFATVLLAGKLIQLLYRQPLPEAIPVLQILAISLVFTFINVLNTQLLIAFNQQGSTARFLIFTSSMNLLLNLLFAAQLGAIGAAIARVVSIFALFVLTSLITRKFTQGFNGLSYAWRPVISATIMGGVIWYLDSWGLMLQIIIGGLTYLILLLALGTFTPTEKAVFQNAIKQKIH